MNYNKKVKMKTQQILLTALLFVFLSCNTQAQKMKIEYVGNAAAQKDMHVWGSSPVQDKNGKTHLFAAQWSTASQPGNFSGWFKDCEIGHYVAIVQKGLLSM